MFLSSRELSAKPGQVLRGLRRAAPTVITANGKPVAIMVGTTEGTIATDLRRFSLGGFADALEKMRVEGVASGVKMTMAEINAEIKAARHERRRRNLGADN